ncbi:hypothetical protein N7495_006313 [Penicillium taxi]|uniref:uncharacterized protein n=1 Tax=Penicillium taxi TaxID=168475 RepID=UPI002545A531|nr:uncharacterized protein N7495_006313 [Penicillium taxi]KAJ5894622.1 hypothetical protein N7495_006313 [Penicillium taxi]
MHSPYLNTEGNQERDPDIERFDQNGDLILVVNSQLTKKTRRFLVSSNLLGLASPVFKESFGSNIREGLLANQACPEEVPLPEDDPDTMGALLAILHYQEPQDIAHMDTMWLASLASLCDKYDCVKAFRAWFSIWFNNIKEDILSPQDYGHLMVAAHLIQDGKLFTELTVKAQLRLPPAFALEWEKSEIMKRLPGTIKGDLEGRIKKLLNLMQYELQSIEASLRDHQKGSWTVCAADEHIRFWQKSVILVKIWICFRSIVLAITGLRNTSQLYGEQKYGHFRRFLPQNSHSASLVPYKILQIDIAVQLDIYVHSRES